MLLKGLPAAALFCLALTASPAAAQTTIDARLGLERHYRAGTWAPLYITLTHQGAPARVEVRARCGFRTVHEYRLPARTLQSGAQEQHIMYVRSDQLFSPTPVRVSLLRDGKEIQKLEPPGTVVDESEWLVVAVGKELGALRVLSGVAAWDDTGNPAPSPGRRIRRAVPRNRGVGVKVATLAAADLPGRSQGLRGADMVVLGRLSERDLTPDQITALRDYATGGGHLVVCGGPDWQRLTTPFFRSILPAEVTGLTGVSAIPAMGYQGPVVPFCRVRPLAGAITRAQTQGSPLVVQRRYGLGRTTFLAVDPGTPSLATANRISGFWGNIAAPREVATFVGQQLELGQLEGLLGYYDRSSNGLAQAPYSINQLDIPSFYLIAGFLLLYILILVPGQYFFLKARDKREYAWITSPLIALIFSGLAYGVGYYHKGGRTLVVQAGMLETSSGHPSAYQVAYSGVFSPSKRGYDIRPAAGPGGATPLLTDVPSTNAPGLRIIADDEPRLEDVGIDMWAMRVIQADGVIPIGKGITVDVRRDGTTVQGTVKNGTGFDLLDSYIAVDSLTAGVGDVPAGETRTFSATMVGGAGLFLPPKDPKSSGPESAENRLRTAVVTALNAPERQGGNPLTNSLRLVGWRAEPAVDLEVAGQRPRVRSATAVVVHVAPNSAGKTF